MKTFLRHRALESWLKAQANVSRHWKLNGPTVTPQWAGDANKLLELARELFLEEPGMCATCDRFREARCDFPECTHGVDGIDGPRHGPAADGSQKPNDAAAIPCAKAGSNTDAIGVQPTNASVPVAVLREHWLHAMECDHEAGRDKPHCACSLVDLGWHPSVGAAVEAWLAHVAGVRPVEPPTLLTREEVHAALPAPTTSGEFHGSLNVQMTWHHFNEWAENIQRAVLAKHAIGVQPSMPLWFDKDKAHRLIYDLFINDDKVIRSMAAQSLKHLLGITGPVPKSRGAGVQTTRGGER